MHSGSRLSVQAYFLHERLLHDLIPSRDHDDFVELISRRERAVGHGAALSGAYEDVVASVIEAHQAVELSIAFVEERLSPGVLVVMTQDFYGKQLDQARGRIRGKLDVDRDVVVEGRFSLARTVGATGRSEIFGHHRYTVLAYLESDQIVDEVRTLMIRPLFIGFRVDPPDAILSYISHSRPELHPSMVDQFGAVDFSKHARTEAVEALGSMSEDAVKHAFADIIGETYVGKDWGGEASDLFTDRLTVSGTPLTAAFAFKGPGMRGPLYIGSMGKRGDQAIRLAGEPAELLVVQHHNKIEPAVRHMLTALARERGKRFMLLDGQTSALILDAYGKLR